jgi:hypothetical protein
MGEEALCAMTDEAGLHGELGEPAGGWYVAVEVDFSGATGGQVVGEAVVFEGGAAADVEWIVQQLLERDDHLLPSGGFTVLGSHQTGGGAPVDATDQEVEPAMGDILAPQAAGIAVTLKPCGIDQEPFRQMALQPV